MPIPPLHFHFGIWTVITMEMVTQTTPLKTVNLENYVATNGDCDDNNPDVSSLTSEICNGYDDDCDELIDSEDSSWDASSGIVVYLDNDGDGSGKFINTK